jgi:hypothetical protein
MRRKAFEESKSRGVEESAILAPVEAALSTLARVERAPELNEDLHRRIAGRRGRRMGWAWAVAGGVVAVALGVVAWPRGGQPPRTARHPRVHQMKQVAAAPMVGLRGDTTREAQGGAAHARTGAQARDEQAAGMPANDRRDIPALQGTAGGQADGDLRTLRGDEAPKAAGFPSTRLGVNGDPALQRRAGVQASDAQAAGIPASDRRDISALPGTAEAGETPALPGGVILVLGRPEPVLPSGRCYVEVTLADGTKTLAEQSVQRDAAGRPQMVQISYEQMEPNAASVQQGG